MRKRNRSIRETLSEALNLLEGKKNGTVWRGDFLDVYFHLGVARYQNHSLESTYQAMSNINQDVWNVCTLITRMEWFRTLAIKGRSMPSFSWILFTSVDIEHFHVELRSILDYVATILGNLAERPKQVRSGSFRALYQWLEKDQRNVAKLGNEASVLVVSAPWYRELRGIRDSILHYGAHTIVFGAPKDGIHFQVHSGLKRLINVDSLMWNENVVDFQLYAGLYVARTLVFLEELGRFVAARIPKWPPGEPGTRANYHGFTILRNWMTRLLAELED